MTPVMGIDPGVNGGLAVLNADGEVRHLRAFQPQMTHGELVEAVTSGVKELWLLGSRSVFMEKVSFIRGDGGQGAFTFGQVNGLIRGTLHALKYPPRDVLPMAWQARLECLTDGNKNVSKRKATELWPSAKWTHAVADAALIAKYGQLVLTSQEAHN